MSQPILFAALCLVSIGVEAANLTEVETRWLNAGAPVLAYAKQIKLPLDIIVQPQAKPGDVPFAMGFDGGRCKLVLSMRGNPQAEDILEPVPADQRALMIEAMTAHEIGHCWRYTQGNWHRLPRGMVEVGEQSAPDRQLLQDAKEQRETRREEGFSDLVALAWTWRRHPDQYGQVYAWLEQVRGGQPVPGGSHDTVAWRRLAADGAAFAASDNPFEQVRALWSEGLTRDQ
jgi:hypothetical protein